MPPITEAQREYRRRIQGTPENRAKKRAYDKAKYQRNRNQILDQQRAARQDPAFIARKRAYDKHYYTTRREQLSALRKRRYALKRYGTDTLPPRPKKEPTCRSTSSPARSKNGSKSKPKTTTPRTSRPASPRSTTGSAISKPLASKRSPSPTPPKPTWHPQPVEIHRARPPKPTSYLCSAGHAFDTRRSADTHTRRHEAAA